MAGRTNKNPRMHHNVERFLPGLKIIHGTLEMALNAFITACGTSMCANDMITSIFSLAWAYEYSLAVLMNKNIEHFKSCCKLVFSLLYYHCFTGDRV
jgi:hypothetical protein